MEAHRNSTGDRPERSLTIPIITSPDWLNDIMKNTYRRPQWRASSVNNQSDGNRRPKIQKVPEKLSHSGSEICYVPSVVSVGPYHHGGPKLQAAEELKPAIAGEFAEDYGIPIDCMYDKVAGMAGDALNCYEGLTKDDLDDEAFKKMLFLDGCFVVHFICCKVFFRTSLYMKQEMSVNVYRDLLLLENQLPFEVLDALLSFPFEEKVHRNQILEEFIGKSRPPIPQRRDKNISFAYFLFTHFETKKDEVNPIHLLECLHMKLCGKWRPPNPSSPDLLHRKSRYPRRTVNEIKATGVHFRATKTRNLKAMKFERGFITSTLRLPQMIVDDCTKSIILNLVAYELCPDTRDDYVVSSYVRFVNSLITDANDVKELKSKGILLNLLESDQHVVDMFNEVAYGLVINPDLYVDVQEQIEKQSREKCQIWMRDLLQTNFRTPWTVLGFLAAFYVIFLATVQTYFTVFPLKRN